MGRFKHKTKVDSRRFRSIQIHSGLFDCFTSYSRPRNLWKMQICMRRFSATTPALYNTKRGRGLRRSSRSLRSCVGKEPSLEIYWVTSRNLLSVCSVTLPDLVNISPPQLPQRLYSPRNLWKMQICMGRFSATTPALYNTNRGEGTQGRRMGDRVGV